MRKEISLTHDFLFQDDGAGAARRTLDPVAKLADVNFQLADGSAEGVAVHAKFAGGPALVAFVLLKNSQDKTFLELANPFRIKNVASVHL